MWLKSMEARFQGQLLDACCWDDLAQAIVQYTGTVTAATSVFLSVRNADHSDFSYAAHWHKDGTSPTDDVLKQFVAGCESCLAATSSRDMVVNTCSITSGPQELSSSFRYCAPLVYQNQVIAILQIFLPRDSDLSSHQYRALTRVLPEMSLTIANMLLQNSLIIQADETKTVRHQIAQDLHDSLAHSIGFLRLKLDQFSTDGMQLDAIETQADIERMREAAEEAYEQIRCTLADLEPVCSNDLAGELLERANVIGHREGFEVQMVCSGEPIPVASEVQRQVLYICREALNNAGRHGEARRVGIHLHWRTDYFTISITDDGTGFVPDEVPIGEHFGLAIMKQRALSIAANLTIRSSPGTGTQLFLWSPATYRNDHD